MPVGKQRLTSTTRHWVKLNQSAIYRYRSLRRMRLIEQRLPVTVAAETFALPNEAARDLTFASNEVPEVHLLPFKYSLQKFANVRQMTHCPLTS